MNTGLITGIISIAVALLGTVSTLISVLQKYKTAKENEKKAEKKEFYLSTAYNIVIEAERMFGDGNGSEKKQYALTKLQNEALSSDIVWDLSLASSCIEQAVALRNDYKGQNLNIKDVVKVEIDEAKENTKEVTDELKEAVTDTFKQVLTGVETIKNNIENKACSPDKVENKETVIKVVEN